jgi:GTP-binding protein
MSFIDTAEVTLVAGNGGNGVVSFRHEKFVDKGGPDGGNGGKGGDIILVASTNQNTLSNYRFHKELRAPSGNPGSKRKKNGRGGEDLVLSVPMGTVVIDESGIILADLTKEGKETVIAKGGRGGFGNAHFLSSTRQVPRIAEKGEKGERLRVTFELKVIADVGLVGLPNAGKSTLLSVLSNAKPEIANYPFTTLTPNLGMVAISDSHNLLFADIPGLIEGAAQGKGLGDEFLRHVERTLVLIHLIDCGLEDVVKAYKTIQKELSLYKIDLSDRPQVVVLNKIDTIDKKTLDGITKKMNKVIPKGTQILSISAASRINIKELLDTVASIVSKERARVEKIVEESTDKIPILRLSDDEKSWIITKVDDGFMITGKSIESFSGRTDYDNEHSVQRLRDIMKKTGIMHELLRQGLNVGDIIHIGKDGRFEF